MSPRDREHRSRTWLGGVVRVGRFQRVAIRPNASKDLAAVARPQADRAALRQPWHAGAIGEDFWHALPVSLDDSRLPPGSLK
jgi:hypothetical protein